MSLQSLLPIHGNVARRAGRRDARAQVLRRIEERLSQRGETLASAIRARQLYFRVSVLGACNLRCPFCHNEGAPTSGRLDLGVARRALREARGLGFRRVQLTGGEPLLRPDVADFVRAAKEVADNVGVTTNGTYLDRRLADLVCSGIGRIHVSLQVESLVAAGSEQEWEVPDWLEATLAGAEDGHYALRLNLPVPAPALAQAAAFLETMARFGCDVKVFSILPEGKTAAEPYPLDRLEEIVAAENERRARHGLAGRIRLRGYRPPNGLRCRACDAFTRCREQSHSLRLGSDEVLRPCLATRAWDERIDPRHLRRQMREAALLALDYAW